MGTASVAMAGAPVEVSLHDDGVHRAPDGHLLVWVAVHNPATVPTVVDVSVEGSPVVDRLPLPGLAHRGLFLFTSLEEGPVEIAARTAGGETTRLAPHPLPPRPPARTCAAVGLGRAATASLPAEWEATMLPALPDAWGPYLAYPVWLVAAEEIARASEDQRSAMTAATAAGARIVTLSAGAEVHLPSVPDPRSLLPAPSDPTPSFPSSLAATLTRAAIWQVGGALCLAILALSGLPGRRTLLLTGAVIIAVGTASPLLYPRGRVKIAYTPAPGGQLEEALVTISGGAAGPRVSASGHAWLPVAAAPGLRWIETGDGLVLHQEGRLPAPATAEAVTIAHDAAGLAPSPLRDIGRGG